MMYGDKWPLDNVDEQNNMLALAAIQASADKIFPTWKTKTVADISSFAAWESVMEDAIVCVRWIYATRVDLSNQFSGAIRFIVLCCDFME
jgi:hypothetical protein